MNSARQQPGPLRPGLPPVRRLVVKIGSRVLVRGNGQPHLHRIRSIVADIVALHRQGREVVVVSSGAIGCGMDKLGLKRRPTNLPDLQMAAAVGQNRLMSLYEQLFSRRRCRIGQILLTHDDLRVRTRHLNARNTVMNLLRHRIIPIVNENDVVAVDEIKLGDNDILAALVAILIQADLLVLLTTTNGLRAPAPGGRTRRLPFIAEINAKTFSLVRKVSNEISTGGMSTKLRAAAMVNTVGIPAVIADGRRPGTLADLLEGEDTGTLIGQPGRAHGRLSGRKRWIAFFQPPAGTIVVDEGARQAIEKNGRSLLPIGIKDVHGEFPVGAVVNIAATDGMVVARGLVEYSSDQIRVIRGHRTTEIKKLLGRRDFDEVIHRDNMVLVQQPR